jgi:hypothetical protein
MTTKNVEYQKMRVLAQIQSLPAIMNNLKFVGFFFISVLLSCGNPKDSNIKESQNSVSLFSKIDFDKAVACDFAGNTNIPLLDSSGQVANTVTKQVILDTNHLKEFSLILMDSKTFGDMPPIDFYPHFGIVFYKKDKIIASLEASLVCSNLYATFDIPEKSKRKYTDDGLTELGKERIYAFCKKLGFTQYLGKGYQLYEPTDSSLR